MGEKIEIVDRISELPTCILHDILFHLPPKDQARTRILSKSWNTLVWSSLPQRSFYFNQNVLLGKEPALWTNDSEKQQYYVNRVDLTLQRLQNERFKISAFRIVIQCLSLDIFASIDRWLQLLAKNHLWCLFFTIRTSNYAHVCYTFPKIALASTVPLKILDLAGCRLQRNSLCYDDDQDDSDKVVSLPLRKLSLFEVVVDNQNNIFQNFVSRCPSLLYLRIKSCSGVKHLRLVNHPKLRELSVQVRLPRVGEKESLERVEVESLDLHTVTCRGMYHKPLIVEATRCRNLRRLHITFAKLEDDYLKNIFTNFPILETLSLITCTGLNDMEVLRHPMLKVLRLSRSDNLVNLSVIDAPNLLSFRYSRNNLIPSKLSLSNASSSSILLKDFCLKLYLKINLKTAWFLELRTYLGQFTEQNLTISLNIRSWEYDFNMDELREVPILRPMYNVELLELYFSRSSRSYDGLINGLFWCFHPKFVHVTKNGVHGNDFVKILYQILSIAKKEDSDPDCCGSRDLKCWHHFLKDFTVKEKTGANLFKPLQNFASYNDVVFTLSWL